MQECPNMAPNRICQAGGLYSCSYAEPLAKKKNEIMKPVAPGPQLLFADALRVADKDLAKSDIFVPDGFDFNFFAECHSVAGELHLIKRISAEYPHARLRIVDPSEK